MYFNSKIIDLSRKLFLSLISMLLFLGMKAQLPKNFNADIELQSIGTTNGVVPFWMRSNQFGAIPQAGFSQVFGGSLYKNYTQVTTDSSFKRGNLIDWSSGFNGRINVGRNINLQLIEAYVKGRLGIFQLTAGRTKDVMGLNGDTILSSGNFSVSGNALGIPKLEISIPNYYRLPIFQGLFSVKGNFSHGWVGKVSITQYLDSGSFGNRKSYKLLNNQPTTYLHQKSFYGMIGKPHWKLKFYGGFNHEAFWGSEQEAFGSRFKLSPIETLYYVTFGKAYGTSDIPRSKIGNHLGSVDIGATYEFNSFQIMIYRQNFYDTGALASLANIRDGLNGVTFTNKNFSEKESGFKWKKFLVEVFYSKNQAGEAWSKPTASGDEDYYNNYYYLKGWSYKSIGLGNPLITSKQYAREGQAKYPLDYFINNRVIAIHVGLNANYNKWEYITKLTYSSNYGTFGTAEIGHTTGQIKYPPTGGLFKSVNQLSMYLNATRSLKNGLKLNYILALDNGKLLNDALGFSLGLSKSL